MMTEDYKEKYEELKDLVTKMRDLQKRYFIVKGQDAEKSNAILIESKNAEAKVDEAILPKFV